MHGDEDRHARILVVDDEEVNVRLIELILGRAGYENLRGTTDPRQALPLFLEFAPDLILLDLMMPRLDGYQVMNQIRRAVPEGMFLPILVLTVDITPEAKQRALSGGATDFLTKPFDSTEVLLRIANLLQTRRLHLLLQEQNVLLEEQVRERTRDLRESEETLRTIFEQAAIGIALVDMQGHPIESNPALQRILGYGADELRGMASAQFTHPDDVAPDVRLFEEMVAGARDHYSLEKRYIQKDGQIVWGNLTASLVRDMDGTPKYAVGMVEDITERRRAGERIRLQIERLAALRAVDVAISSSLDLRVTLGVLLDQVTAQLRVDAAAVLLLNPHTQMLEYAAGRGFRTDAIVRSRVRLGEGYAGRAALEQRALTVENLAQDSGSVLTSVVASEGFIAYAATPLLAKGQTKGVLEVFHRSRLEADEEWSGFFEALAGQAAIAIDNAALFGDLQRANVELVLAYDTTLEGWSQAMDLRDKETEGHTIRVTEVTLRLARAMGMSEAELVHVRRGALLHDIGKMGIPDAILLKPGPLNDEEWAVMRRHPDYAHELLSPIAFLRPAMEIPYSHHERWDGAGYPLGLAGEQIPLAARIFAAVDVWDALRSDRPYRPGWPEERVRTHLSELAGTHLDPRVVEAFLRLLASDAAVG